MKQIYTTPEIDIFIFKDRDVIVASGEAVFEPNYVRGDNETDLLGF